MKGQTREKIFGHILLRSMALIVMGFFMVNLENINEQLLAFSKYTWQLIMTLAFFFIWMDYSSKDGTKKSSRHALMILGVLMLLFLAWVYEGGSTDNPVWMKTYWWGILGLIGWAYLVNATIYMLVGGRLVALAGILLIFHLLNLQEFIDSAHWPGIRLVVSASNHACVAGGMLASVILIKLRGSGKLQWYVWVLFCIALVFVAYGYAVRPEWGISKIRATPSWTAICTGISFASLAVVYIITDVLYWRSWFKWISPAGTSTLTCYLVPYLYYAFLGFLALQLPLVVRTGFSGVIKSILFALLIILITGLLERGKIKLKI
jgi:hypothetical protein